MYEHSRKTSARRFYRHFSVAPFGSVGENNPVFFVCIDPIETRKHKQLCRQSDTESLDSSRTISLGPVRFDRHRSKRTNTRDAVHAHSTSRRNINNPRISGALNFPMYKTHAVAGYVIGRHYWALRNYSKQAGTPRAGAAFWETCRLAHEERTGIQVPLQFLSMSHWSQHNKSPQSEVFVRWHTEAGSGT